MSTSATPHRNGTTTSPDPTLLLAGLTLLGLVTVITLSGVRFANPVWQLENRPMTIMLLIGAVNLLTVAPLAIGKVLGSPANLLPAIPAGAAASAPLFVNCFPEFSRTLLVIGSALASALAWPTAVFSGRVAVRVATIAAFAPSASMFFGGIPGAGTRASLIDYLTSLENRLEVAPPRTGVD